APIKAQLCDNAKVSQSCHERCLECRLSPLFHPRGPIMNSKRTLLKSVAAAALATLALGTAHAADITGAGATFPFPIYAKWAEMYKAQTGTGLNYQSIGSS